jgi:hypothetical protein
MTHRTHPIIIDDLRSLRIEDGVNFLHPRSRGRPIPVVPGHAAEVIRTGGGGRLFIAVLQPEARADGWTDAEEEGLRTTLARILATDFRGHGDIEVRFLG